MAGNNLYAIADQLGHRNKNGQVSIEMIFKHYGTYIKQVAEDEFDFSLQMECNYILSSSFLRAVLRTVFIYLNLLFL